jgi:hypothetical protein
MGLNIVHVTNVVGRHFPKKTMVFCSKCTNGKPDTDYAYERHHYQAVNHNLNLRYWEKYSVNTGCPLAYFPRSLTVILTCAGTVCNLPAIGAYYVK